MSDILLRGGHAVELQKELQVFTAFAPKPADRLRLAALAGVTDVRQVAGAVYRVHVAPKQLERAMDDYRAGSQPAVCHHAYKPQGATSTRFYLSDQLIVRFHKGVSKLKQHALLQSEGLRAVRSLPGKKPALLVQVTARAGKNPLKAGNALCASPLVEFAEPDLINRFTPAYIPSDPGFQLQWHLRSREARDVLASADIGATLAWELTRGARDVVLAVIDDGFELSHPDFSGANKIVHPLDFADMDADPSAEGASGDLHGTPCAGIALAEENGSGVVGVAPGCAFMPVRVSFRKRDSDWVQIFDEVGRRADVISCSWGPPPVWAPLPLALSEKLHEVAEHGGPNGRGCVIVFAAHNYNAPLQDTANTGFEWRSGADPTGALRFTTEPIVNGWAAHPAVVTVAACTSLNRKAAYSNWGTEVSLCAPSSNGHPIDPRKALPGLGLYTTDNELLGAGFQAGSSYTSGFGGTSGAAPIVAGVAALVRSANPQLTALEIKRVLQETADQILDDSADPVLGLRHGTYAAGHSHWFGAGKVNAGRAVLRARDMLLAASGAVRGNPRADYSRVYLLLPQDSGTDWLQALVSSGQWARTMWTVGFSADDAGVGALARRSVLAINPERWGADLDKWYAEHYPGTTYVAAQAASPQLLTDYLGTHAVPALIAAQRANGGASQSAQAVTGRPRAQYGRVYLLLPQSTPAEHLRAVVDSGVLVRHRYSVGFSADDAGIGDLDSRTVLAVNPEQWGADLAAWYAEHYPGVLYQPLRADSADHLRALLASR